MAASGESPSTLCSEAIIRGIPRIVTEDYLMNFLECHVPDCHVKQVQFKKKSAALVTFGNSVDFQMLEKICENAPVEDRKLNVLQVDKRGAVLIRNPNPQTTTNSFKYYLSNTKRSGGSKVVDVHRDEKNLFLIVYYSSRKEAEAVAQRKHTLESQELELEFFDPNFGELPDSNQDRTTEHELPVSHQSDTSFRQSAETRDHTDIPSAKGSKSREIPDKSKDATVQERKIEYSVRDVTGLCILYQKILDIFITCIPKQQLDIQMDIGAGAGCLKIQGEQHDVEKAETLVYCLCEKQTSSEFVNGVATLFTGWDEVFEEIQGCVDKREYIMVIQEGPFGIEEFYIHQLPSGQSLAFDDLLKKFVCCKTVAVKSEGSEELLKTTTWDEFRETDMDGKFGNQVTFLHNEKDHKIEVFGNVSLIDDAVKSVELFLMNLHDEQHFSLCGTEKDFLQKYWLRDQSSVQTGTDIDFAEVILNGFSLNIKGCRAGVWREVRKVETFRKKFKCKRAILTHPKLARFQHENGELWRDLVMNISKENRCLIKELSDPRIRDADEDHNDWGQWVAAVIQSFSLPGQHHKLHVVEGKTEDLKVDAVVICSENNTLQQPLVSQPQGARPKNFPAGQEHRPLVQQREGIQVTQPGARPAKAVVQVSLPFYFPSNAHTSWEMSVDKLVAELFHVCDHYGFRSMALPVFGVDVGQSMKPIDVATRVLTESITKECCRGERSEVYKNSGSVQQLFVCSPRAACLHALTYALQDDLAWMVSSPTPESLSFLATDMPKHRRILSSGAIEISWGDISRALVDALVVPCDIDIDLDLSKSQVTRSLMLGGSIVQSSLLKGEAYISHDDQTDKRNEELAEQRILAGKGGTLGAKHIFYVFLPPWGPTAKQALVECVRKSLQKASDKNFRSVALTALGTGKLCYPPKYAARTALSAVSEFMEREKTSLTKVHFVIFDQTTYDIYEEEHWEWQKHLISCSGAPALPRLEYPYHTIPASSNTSHAAPTPYAHSRSAQEAVNKSKRVSGYGGTVPDSITINNIKLRIMLGNIIREKCDVVVNSTNVEFDFKKGSVSRAFEKCSGDFLVRICKKKQNMKEMKKNGVVVTEGPGLPYNQAILHLDLEKFRQSPKETLLKCLTTLLSKLPQIQTVAFPALGAGASRFNQPEHVLTSMIEALQDLKKQKKLEEVRLIVSGNDLYLRLTACLAPHVSPQASHPPNSHSKQDSRQSAAPSSKSLAKEPPPPSANPASLPSNSSRILVTKVPRSQWADGNALSLFVFSDNEECWQRACSKLAEEIESCLGPVSVEPDRDEARLRWSQDDDIQPGCWSSLTHVTEWMT